MGVANSGTGVLVDASGVALAGFTNAAASNIKTQDSTVYTITSNAVGSNATGPILLAKASGAVAALDSNHTFICSNASIQNGSNADAPISNLALSIKGAKLVFVGPASAPEGTAPIIGDSETQVIYRRSGSTWNSVHPGVNIDGSTFIFQSSGDGHLGRHPSATVKNPTLLWTGTSPSGFVLGANQAWGTDNKPSAMDGFVLQSINGNTLVSAFTWNVNQIPGLFPNNYFFVCKDWTCNVAAVGTRPTALKRSYRRAATTAMASSYWGAVSVCPTLLHIDLKTTLSAAGVLGSAPTYLRTVDYNVVGTSAGDTCVDVLSLRFKPTLVDPIGNKLANTSIVVLNTNANCSASNAIGNFRARLAASGSTDSTGQIVITEPSTKDYTSNASHRTDSIVIRNRTLTTAWHKWWEAGTKLIPIADSRNGTGSTAPESYAANEFVVSYRRAGSQFLSAALDMSTPRMDTIALSADANYNAATSTTGTTVSYSAGVTTAALADGSYTLDGIWKAVIDFHAHPDRNETESVLPFTEWTAGEMHFGAALRITGSSAAVINSGSLVSKIVSSVSESFNTPGNPTVTASFKDTDGTRVTISDADGRLTSFHAWVYDSASTLVYDSTFNSQVESITVTVPDGGSVRVYSQPYGYISKITNVSNPAGNLQINHTPEAMVDTSLDTTIRNEIESHFSSVMENNIVYVETDADFAQYTPAQVLNGMHYFIVNRGFLLSASSLAINSVDSVKLIEGGFRVYSPGFRGRAKSTLNGTNTPSLFVTLPLYIEDATGVPGNQVFVRNANGIAIVSALWTKATANISNNDIVSIATRVDQSAVLAKEATLAGKASQASVTALGTPAQATALAALATDNQAEHDATQAAISALPAPPAVVQANIVQVNGVAVDGTGVEGDEWGPVGSAP